MIVLAIGCQPGLCMPRRGLLRAGRRRRDRDVDRHAVRRRTPLEGGAVVLAVHGRRGPLERWRCADAGIAGARTKCLPCCECRTAAQHRLSRVRSTMHTLPAAAGGAASTVRAVWTSSSGRPGPGQPTSQPVPGTREHRLTRSTVAATCQPIGTVQGVRPAAAATSA